MVGADPETTELTRRGRRTLAVQVTVLANILFCSITGLWAACLLSRESLKSKIKADVAWYWRTFYLLITAVGKQKDPICSRGHHLIEETNLSANHPLQPTHNEIVHLKLFIWLSWLLSLLISSVMEQPCGGMWIISDLPLSLVLLQNVVRGADNLCCCCCTENIRLPFMLLIRNQEPAHQ